MKLNPNSMDIIMLEASAQMLIMEHLEGKPPEYKDAYLLGLETGAYLTGELGAALIRQPKGTKL